MTETDFCNLQPLAIFGVSSKGRGFGVVVYQELTKVGVKVYPLNPKGGNVLGQPIYMSLKELPERPRAAVILTKGEGAIEAVEECSRHNLEWIWLQGGSNRAEVRRLCAELGIKTINGTCILLHKGGFPHNLHRFFHDLFKRKS